MRTTTKILTGLLVVAAGGWFAGCNSTIDKEPDVVLEIENLTVPPITSTANGPGGTCVFSITQATGTFRNKPKNQFASASPFNDILLQSLTISYVWDDGLVQPNVVAGLGGSVPADGSSTASFSVVSSEALAVGAPGFGRAGHTASLGLTFAGTTVSGDGVSTTTGGTLQVNSCTVNIGACCGGITSNGCTDGKGQQQCTSEGGVYQGDFTTCATLPNSCP